jgi:hypothetical protein
LSLAVSKIRKVVHSVCVMLLLAPCVAAARVASGRHAQSAANTEDRMPILMTIDHATRRVSAVARGVVMLDEILHHRSEEANVPWLKRYCEPRRPQGDLPMVVKL